MTTDDLRRAVESSQRGRGTAMTTDKKRVRAVVRVVLDIEADSVWDDECSWAQIARQAEDSVRGLLTNGNPLSLKEIPHRLKSFEMVEVKVRPERKT